MSTTRNKQLMSHKKKKKNESKKNKGLFLETYSVAPSPSRDYYGLQLYQKKFQWTKWKVAHFPFMNPTQKEVSLDEYLKDNNLQNELTYIFGEDVTDLLHEVAHENWSLVTMPSCILENIFSYISAVDVLHLSQVCKRLSKECTTNELWQKICKRQWKILIHSDIEKAGLIGWKNLYLEKMRPKRYKLDPSQHRPKPNIIPRNRFHSVSMLNSPDSRLGSSKSSSMTVFKKIQEIKKAENVYSSSEMFDKEFKVGSAASGRSTDRTYSTTTKTYFVRPLTGKPPSTPVGSKLTMDKLFPQNSTRSVNYMIRNSDAVKEADSKKNRSPRTSKSKVTSLRARSISQSIQPTDSRSLNSRSKTTISRPTTGKSIK